LARRMRRRTNAQPIAGGDSIPAELTFAARSAYESLF
jgi:hypothetical protein